MPSIPSMPSIPDESSFASPPPVAQGARDEALAWRWVAFGALAIAAAAVAWHRIRPDDSSAAADEIAPAASAAPIATASASAVVKVVAPAPSASADTDSKRSPRWPSRTVSSAGVEPGELLVDEGYLFVESRVKAQVFANGIAIGPTNRRNKATCRYKFVRLGRVAGKWISEGVTVNIACGAVTSVRLDPYPSFGNEQRRDQ
ncbi:MAG TPA: hypothetical protein VFB62_19120, partial [Polyangiaceae bacterium]|nr:hypothetical protein [Polyangiaceae bacterium]